MILGFTGTQDGMTERQLVKLEQMLIDFMVEDIVKIHHGMCIGADEEMHNIADSLNYAIYGHAPIDTSKMMQDYDPFSFAWIFEPKEYLARNHDIVEACDLLIATPKQAKEIKRSGTWATIRYARTLDKQIRIIKP